MPLTKPAAYTPVALETLAAADHQAGLHQTDRDTIRQICDQLGTNLSTPTANTVYRGTGTGTAAYGQVQAGDLTPGTSTLLKISEASGTGSSGVISFTSIPATYRSLLLQVVGRSDTAGTGGAAVRLTFESSPTAGAYDHQILVLGNTTFNNSENIGASDFINVGGFPSAGAAANLYGYAEMMIPEYANTSIFKPVFGLSAALFDLATGSIELRNTAGVWESTAVVSTIRLTLSTGNWTTASRATLWGRPA